MCDNVMNAYCSGCSYMSIDVSALIAVADEIEKAGKGERIGENMRRNYQLMPATANDWADRIRKAVW